jgi:transcriptional accessory protein Tex/SPT6
LSEKADNHAIQVFATNLRALLGQPPLAGQTVLGIDPGLPHRLLRWRSSIPTGKLLDTGTIYPHEPQKKWERSHLHAGGDDQPPSCHTPHHWQRHRFARDRTSWPPN